MLRISPLLRKAVVISGVALVFATPVFSLPQENLRIPRLGLNYPINRVNQDRGPYLWFEDSNTIAIAGHRVTPMPPFGSYGPLRYINTLRPGDPIYLGHLKFLVVKHLILLPSESWVLNWAGLILSACTPPGSATYRYVILAKPA